jgi:hypothetical protein
MNELIITKAVPQADKHLIIDWLYGNNDKFIGGSTVIDCPDLSFADRNNLDKTKEKLLSQVSLDTLESMLHNAQIKGN